jgi:hypothetical protein
MKLFIDVTSSRRSRQSAGMQRMTRKIFAELSRPTDVRPIYRNTLGNFFTELGKGVAPSMPKVIGRLRIADYNRISILSYKLL